MKKQNIFSAIFMMCMMLVGCIAFTGCGKEDDLDTNQYGNGVSLNVYGPSPVARGGQLRFIGTNLSQITEVVFPGGASVSDIKVVNDREIEVTVPQDAQPGLITLVYASGKITTLTPLAYTEPVGFDENTPFTPATVKAGQKLTIAGEYLNLVTGVEFAEGVLVEKTAFTEHTRKAISLVVPAEAQTGKVALTFCATGDTIPNVIYSDVELKVILPAVAEVINIEGAKPGQEITITGTDFDLITAVVMPNGETVEFEPIDDAISGIKFKLPASISTGYIRVVPASGVEVIVANNGVAEPAELVATPNTELRDGDIITITGKNLDVVTNITLPGVSDVVNLEKGGTAEKIQVKTLPGFTSGNMLLNTGFGVSFPVAITTAKPALTAYNPSPASAGSDLTITGENLDLVKTITFAEKLVVSEFKSKSATEIVVTIPTTAVTGALTITMTNGETVEFAEASIDSPVFCFIPELPADDAEIKAGSVLTVNVVNGDKLTGVQIDGQDCQFIMNGDVLMVNIPESAGLSSVTKLISSNGEVEYNIAFIPNTQQKRIVWQGMTEITWNDGGRVFIPGTALDDVPEGAIMTFCYTQKDQVWAQAQVNNGWWGNSDISTFITPEGSEIKNPIVPTDIYGWFSDGVLNRETSIVLTAELLEHLRSHVGGDGNAIIIQGQDLIFTQVYISWEISLEVDIKDFTLIEDRSANLVYPYYPDWGDGARKLRIMRSGLQDLKLKAGKSKFIVYKSAGSTGQLQINNPNWSAFTTLEDWSGSETVFELVFTEDMIKCVTGEIADGWSETAFILQGSGLEITKMTILP